MASIVAPARWGWPVSGELDVAELRRAAGPVPVTVVDLRHSSRDGLEQLAVQEAQRLGPTARICLVRLGEREQVVLCTTRRPLATSELGAMVAELLQARDVRWVPGEPPAPMPPLALPTDRPRPATRRFRGATVSERHSDTALLTWCADHDVEFVDLLLAGLAAVLARYCDDEDVTFAADLPTGASTVRVPWSDSDTPVTLVDKVTARSPGAEVPAGQVLFTYAEGVVPIDTGWTDRDLRVTVLRDTDGLDVLVDYDTDLFGFPSAQRFLARLVRAWSAITELTTMDEFSALTDAELHAVLTEWQGPRQSFPDIPVHELVRAQAPAKLAVVCGSEQLTYGELMARASHTARELREQGAGPERVVGVVADRSVDAVVGLLAVLCAGAAYVPIDPSYPDERIRWMVRDSGAFLLLGTREQLDGLPALPVPTVELSRGPVDPVELEPHSGSLAYLIYTSGSTGRPKGVAVTHRGLTLSTFARRVGGSAPVVDLVTMPLSFDGSAGGLYWTLTTGGTVLLPTDAEARDARLLAKVAEARSVTHIHSIPSHYALLREAGAEHGLAGLRLVSVGGEPLPPKLVERHFAAHPKALLLNDYGPTEATVWSAAHVCSPADGSAPSVPIGPPLPNYRAYVLDQSLRPVPPGISGELYLGGDAVARGYHGRSGLTAEKFLPDPHGDQPGARLYRTGDRVRQRPDGELEILGRVDSQVKVRGFRIELGEIENTLLSHPAVGAAAVVLRDDRLVAYVSPADTLTPDEVGTWLADRLPAYMRPADIGVLDALPRNANGKVDTQALRGDIEPPPDQTSTVDDLASGQVDQLLRHLLDRTAAER
ncbi:non-ribosomal peptide synthetase [Actinocrispum wychmicini]|uniref:Amino acid adenylation domain-containing protein n=1 Tax=Actinocrispum wychmicini TaxID=1213861 RepID=A0A4R2JI52_9PSEU|nr:amino acid adenylation domain-containing protein [Actinocrispum wychmicini]TCO56099.1 amino acid adenylation domain-containing protein [Actinocrispum wychmicini]